MRNKTRRMIVQTMCPCSVWNRFSKTWNAGQEVYYLHEIIRDMRAEFARDKPDRRMYVYGTRIRENIYVRGFHDKGYDVQWYMHGLITDSNDTFNMLARAWENSR